MRKISAITSLRISAFLCFLCILGRVVSDYEFTNLVLSSFPLFLGGGVTYFPLSYMSFPQYILNYKGMTSLVFPFLVNLIFWLPIKRAYYSIYGIVLVEKWKAFFCMLMCGIGIIGSLFFYSYGLPGFFAGFSISLAYYIYLRYVLKAYKKENFMPSVEKEDTENRDYQKIMLVLFIHMIALFYITLEYQYQAKVYEKQLPFYELCIPEAYVRDVSEDGRKVLFVKENPNVIKTAGRGYELGMLDLDEGDTWKVEWPDKNVFFKFLQQDKSIVIAGHNDRKTLIYDLETRRNVKRLEDGELSLTKKVDFSDNDLFLSKVGSSSVIWNYEDGNKIAVYNKRNSQYDLVWIDQNAYVILRFYEVSLGNVMGYNMEVSLNTILLDGSVKEQSREKITYDMNEKRAKVGIGTRFVKNIDEKSICTVVGGNNVYGIFNYMSYMDFWDIEKERKLFSYSTGNEIMDIAFYPEKNQFIVIEKMKDLRIRISFWDMKKRKRERVVFLSGVRSGYRKEHLKIINGGKGFVELSDSVKFWMVN